MYTLQYTHISLRELQLMFSYALTRPLYLRVHDVHVSITDQLHVDEVNSLSVDEFVFVNRWPMIETCVQSMQPITFGKDAILKNFAFVRSTSAGRSNCTYWRSLRDNTVATRCTVRQTVGLLTRNVSATSSWNAPAANMRRATITCMSGESPPVRAQSYSNSPSNSSTSQKMSARLNL